MQQKMRFNRTIKIYKTDMERMKTKIEQRMTQIGDIYNSQFAEDYPSAQILGAPFLAVEIWMKLLRTKHLNEKADAWLANESFDFIYADADEWFDEWDFAEYKEGLIDKYYMLPNSDEVDEIFDSMKADYRYIVTDVFRFFRFYPISDDVVIA